MKSEGFLNLQMIHHLQQNVLLHTVHINSIKNMKLLKFTVTSLLLTLTLSSFAQTEELLSEVPKTKQEFIESEQKVLATIDWLENTPINEQEAKHKEQYALFVAWITNSPTVSIEINAYVLTFTKKNSELLIFFMAGWTKYSLKNNYSKDAIQGNLAGIRSAIKVYNSGGLKKDKNLQKLIDLDKKGELENWVSSQ